MVTIKDLAAKTGFSLTTISLVLNNKSRARSISARTKNLIREAAREVGYRPNLFARSLRARRSFMVGLLVYDILDPYCAPILKHIEAELIPHQYTLLISDLGYDHNRCREALDNLVDRRVDGIICVANQLPFDLETLPHLTGGAPVVLIGRKSRNRAIPYFVVGEEEGGYLQARHLTSLGHRRIAIVWDEADQEWSELRWKGVQRALREAKLTPGLVVRSADPTPDGGAHATRQLLKIGRDFTALLAIDDLRAFGAVRELFDAGINVPEDVSVIGFDDLSVARYFNPTLTTVAQPLDRLGTLATAALLSMMDKRARRPASKILKPHLVERRSTQRRA